MVDLEKFKGHICILKEHLVALLGNYSQKKSFEMAKISPGDLSMLVI